tara:strand:+ start:541 stop:906 length:366 start_codon:yes stop_codon:yes gene_type:complete
MAEIFLKAFCMAGDHKWAIPLISMLQPINPIFMPFTLPLFIIFCILYATTFYKIDVTRPEDKSTGERKKYSFWGVLWRSFVTYYAVAWVLFSLITLALTKTVCVKGKFNTKNIDKLAMLAA